MLDLLSSSFAILIAVTIFLGLIVGSFLNVVIHRLPIMMEKQWQAQWEELQSEDVSSDKSEDSVYNLAVPRSCCPKCGHKITAMENIPIVSYLFLRGRCSECKTPISPRYPLVEAVTTLLSVVVVWHFGFTLQALGALMLTWALIALSMIDFDHKLLPDAITLPLLWLGMLLNLPDTYVDTHDSLIGAMAGYLSLWALFHIFRLLTGKEGMGYGDFKLLACFGAWLGWQSLPLIVILSSLVGAVVGIVLIVFAGRDRQIPIPFGPYLAAAGWIALLWGDQIVQAYYRWSGLGSI